MLLQRSPSNSDFNMASYTSKFSNRIFDPIAPSNSSSQINIPALPPLNSAASSNSDSASGTYSLFSSASSVKPETSNSNSVPHPPLNKSYHGSMHQGGMEPHPSHHGMHAMATPAHPLDQVLGPFPCARIRGLPYDTSLQDVLVFFQGLVVLDVVVVPDAYGHGVCEAFVVFANPMDFQMALQRNRATMGHQYVEVYQGKRSDYYAAIAKNQANLNQQRDESGEGEAYGTHEDKNVWAAGGSEIPTQMPTQQALRPPLTQREANMSSGKSMPAGGQEPGMTKSHSGSSGNRPGRNSGEGGRSKGGAGRGSGRGGGIQVGEHTGYLRMRGLPFTSAKPDIYEFFKEYNPRQDSITLTYRSDGRATGEGYIAFSNPDDAKSAMTLHRNTMGSRYIELFISNKDEHARAQARENNVR